jgi:TPR repeat protein
MYHRLNKFIIFFLISTFFKAFPDTSPKKMDASPKSDHISVDEYLKPENKDVEKIRIEAKKLFDSFLNDKLSMLSYCLSYQWMGKNRPAEIFEWLEEAAEYGNTNAQLDLGIFYLDGENPLIPGFRVQVNIEKASKLILGAAEQNNECAQSWAAYLYKNGIGIKKNLKKAAYYNKRAKKLHMRLWGIN